MKKLNQRRMQPAQVQTTRLTHHSHTFCFRSTISSSPLFVRRGTTIPLFNWSNSSFKLRISFWYFLISDFSSIICIFHKITYANCKSIQSGDSLKEHTLFWAAWISICFARWANFSVLCVSSELLEEGVTVQMSCNFRQ